MLEGLAAWVLNTYLGEYVENLNTDQLSIGLLSGAVELENLPLRKDALHNIDLPVEVKTGFIGKIHLQIPVRALRSDPWVISLEKLYLVAGPASNKKCDVKEEEERLLERKAAVSRQKCNSAQSKDGGSSWYAYSTSVVYNILENLQLNVKDIHIRYEDDVTVPRQSVACGITIDSLSAQSQTQSEEEKKKGMSFKLLNLTNFSIYWDTDAAPLANLAIHALKEAFERKLFISKSRGGFMDHQYIRSRSAQKPSYAEISPPNLSGHEVPLVSCVMPTWNRIQISLSEDQYHGLVTVMKEFERADRARPFRKWRPTASVKER
ncbi:putative vacuolar protein sorting-associated protein 13D-like [Apostichopus japonicus]|uniref:Putative vacuolar protein sorting-associated protein 13D-like n=1 Tax=Stichopus japonicus TaxID=307972 RepID=A0A2G8LF34_STIJA|nr:putative vacuolar protein sorting-associated protein 13D-like [Apostichopus japonicus]